MPSIWEGSPISPIPSPLCSHVDSTELNNEIVEFRVKIPNPQFVNLRETLLKEAENSVISVDGSEACLTNKFSEKDKTSKTDTPKKDTRASKKKKTFDLYYTT